MAKAEKILDGDIQVEPFMPKLAAWLKTAIAKGRAVKVLAITDDDPDFDTEKSDIQREKFHAMIGDIKKTGVIVMPGRKVVMNDYDEKICKAFLVMWFCNEIKELNDEKIKIPNPPKTITCPLTGERITIRPSTIPWGKKLTRIFVEWLYATGSMAGVKWSETAIEAYQSYREARQ
jgi:hypothetical protein